MSKKIKFDDFVKAVRPDPKSVKPLVLLQGFVGESTEKGHIRLYTDAALNNFVELPEDGIVHYAENCKEENPLGGCKLWVKQETVYTFGNPKHVNRPKSSFLEGNIKDTYWEDFGGRFRTLIPEPPTDPTCVIKTPIGCYKTPICRNGTPVPCVAGTDWCGGGRSIYDVDGVQGIYANAGQLGRFVDTPPTPYTPVTPVAARANLQPLINTGFQNFNPYLRTY